MKAEADPQENETTSNDFMKHPKARIIIQGLVEMFRDHVQSIVFINTFMAEIKDCEEVMALHYDLVK